MEKLQQAGGKSLENDFLDDKELDVDAFFDVKQENLVKYPNLMMDQAIEAMTKHLQHPLPPLSKVPPQTKSQNKTHTSLKDSFYGTGGR